MLATGTIFREQVLFNADARLGVPLLQVIPGRQLYLRFHVPATSFNIMNINTPAGAICTSSSVVASDHRSCIHISDFAIQDDHTLATT
jgi:hypothetical protein